MAYDDDDASSVGSDEFDMLVGTFEEERLCIFANIAEKVIKTNFPQLINHYHETHNTNLQTNSCLVEQTTCSIWTLQRA